MTRDVFIGHLEDIMNVSRGTLQGREVLSETSAWDSLAVVSFLAFADKEIGVSVPPAALEKCATVDDLYGVVCKLGQK